MENAQKIEDFYGVYLLCSQSSEKRYRNRCYIGYTVNPNRRINQHNRGIDFGGAKKTNNKGPWTMIMIIHGFPNNISALQFEWAWQFPSKSSRLKMIKDLEKKKRNESHFDYNFRILTDMLRIGPWNRLPLTIRWLASDYVKNFPAAKIPPLHMQICYGHVVIKQKKLNQNDNINVECIGDDIDYKESQTTTTNTYDNNDDMVYASQRYPKECHLCMKIIENPKRSKISCLNPKCKLICHIVCLANLFIEPGHYIPIGGDCPICDIHFLWGDLIRKKNGCNDLEDCNDEEYDEDYYGHNNKNADEYENNKNVSSDDEDNNDCISGNDVIEISDTDDN